MIVSVRRALIVGIVSTVASFFACTEKKAEEPVAPQPAAEEIPSAPAAPPSLGRRHPSLPPWCYSPQARMLLALLAHHRLEPCSPSTLLAHYWLEHCSPGAQHASLTRVLACLISGSSSARLAPASPLRDHWAPPRFTSRSTTVHASSHAACCSSLQGRALLPFRPVEHCSLSSRPGCSSPPRSSIARRVPGAFASRSSLAREYGDTTRIAPVPGSRGLVCVGVLELAALS